MTRLAKENPQASYSFHLIYNDELQVQVVTIQLVRSSMYFYKIILYTEFLLFVRSML